VQRLTGLIAGIEVAIDKIDASVERADLDFQELESQRAELASKTAAAQNATQQARQELAKLQEQLHERRLVRQQHEIKLEQLQERALKDRGYSHHDLATNLGPDQPVETGDEDPTQAVLDERSEQQKRRRPAKRTHSA